MMIKIEKQRGQVLILGIFFTGIALLLTVVYFNTAQNEFERQQATNIADTAVYSGLQFQARSLNYIAYTNRAIIANHVSVGQLVSTSSWLDYVSNTSEVLARVARIIPYIGPFLSSGLNAVSNAADALRQTMPLLIGQSNIAITALTVSQNLVKNVTTADTIFFINRIIDANDERYSLTNTGYGLATRSLSQWHNFTEITTSQEQLDRQAQTISSSIDSWTENREEEHTLLNIYVLRVFYHKNGVTRFRRVSNRRGQNSWVWDAGDSGSLSYRAPIRTPRGLPRGLNNDTYHTSRRTGRASRLEFGARATRVGTYYGGLRHQLNLSSQVATTLSLALEVGIDRPQIRDSETIENIGASNENSDSIFQVESQQHVDEVSSYSQGEIYYERSSSRQDGREEYSNIFNPYWIVRLTKSDSTEKILSQAIKLNGR